ncbi:MAG: hypothetical protein ACOY4M_10565 [Pseudomonadota bacterium]
MKQPRALARGDEHQHLFLLRVLLGAGTYRLFYARGGFLRSSYGLFDGARHSNFPLRRSPLF